MKKSIFAVLSLSLLIGCAGFETVPDADRPIQHTHYIERTKDQIYDRSLEWMARTFSDSKAVLEIKDKENGQIIGKGVSNVSAGMGVSVPCRYTMIINIKDGKYRTTFENFMVLGTDGTFPARYKMHVDPLRIRLEELDIELWNFLFKEKDW